MRKQRVAGKAVDLSHVGLHPVLSMLPNLFCGPGVATAAARHVWLCVPVRNNLMLQEHDPMALLPTAIEPRLVEVVPALYQESPALLLKTYKKRSTLHQVFLVHVCGRCLPELTVWGSFLTALGASCQNIARALPAATQTCLLSFPRLLSSSRGPKIMSNVSLSMTSACKLFACTSTDPFKGVSRKRAAHVSLL